MSFIEATKVRCVLCSTTNWEYNDDLYAEDGDWYEDPNDLNDDPDTRRIKGLLVNHEDGGKRYICGTCCKIIVEAGSD